MYYTTKSCFLAKPICKPTLKFSKKARTKTRYETHKTGWYLDFRAVLTPSLKHEIPNLVFNLVSLEKRFGAIVNWVLNVTLTFIFSRQPKRYQQLRTWCTIQPNSVLKLTQTLNQILNQRYPNHKKDDMKCVCHEGTSILDGFSAIWFSFWIAWNWIWNSLRLAIG